MKLLASILAIAPHPGVGSSYDGPWWGPLIIALFIATFVLSTLYIIVWLTDGGPSRLKRRFYVWRAKHRYGRRK